MTARDRTVDLVVIAVAALALWFAVIAPARAAQAVEAEIVDAAGPAWTRRGPRRRRAERQARLRARLRARRVASARPSPATTTCPRSCTSSSRPPTARVDFRSRKLTRAPAPIRRRLGERLGGGPTQAAAAALPPGCTVGTAGLPDHAVLVRLRRRLLRHAALPARSTPSRGKATQIVVARPPPDRRRDLAGRQPRRLPEGQGTLTATAYLLARRPGRDGRRHAAGPAAGAAGGARRSPGPPPPPPLADLPRSQLMSRDTTAPCVVRAHRPPPLAGGAPAARRGARRPGPRWAAAGAVAPAPAAEARRPWPRRRRRPDTVVESTPPRRGRPARCARPFKAPSDADGGPPRKRPAPRRRDRTARAASSPSSAPSRGRTRARPARERSARSPPARDHRPRRGVSNANPRDDVYRVDLRFGASPGNMRIAKDVARLTPLPSAPTRSSSSSAS